jgi:tetratricopeptide (TPR) repeat protein
MKTPPVRDLNIVGDFLRYTAILFAVFFLMGAVYGLVYEFSFACLILNPLIYSVGISLIIIVITHDVNDILDIVGLGKGPRLGSHIKYAKAVQEIGLLMSRADFDAALKKADNLVSKDPKFTHALNLKGEILLKGFQRYEKARACFNAVLKLSDPGDEQYKLAEALKAETYASGKG